tara:strand:- start:132 stop:515 length:384 start_codon:yes stop_codon:yes gene_type:complete
MEGIDQVRNCLNSLTPAEKRKADAVAGGSFQKILVELQILRNSFGKKISFTQSRNHQKTNRANDILDIFLLQQKAQKESENKIQTFEKGSIIDINKLRRDISAPRSVPVFLEKRFELFGPTAISRKI